MDRTNPEIMVEFHLAKLHRAGSYKDCVVVYPEPNAAAYDMYCIPPMMPHETARKTINRKHRARRANRKYPFCGKSKTMDGLEDSKTLVSEAEDTKTVVLDNTEAAAISEENIDAYHTRRLDAKLAEMMKED